MAGAPQNIWMFCITIEHKKAPATLFAKILTTSYLGTLDILLSSISSKTIIPTCKNFDVHLHAKNELPYLFFWYMVKILQIYYFEYFENAWSYLAVLIVSPCRPLWYPKLWNHRKLWCLSFYKKSTSSLTSFLRYCKDIVNLLFWKLWEWLTILIKITASVFSKISCLPACKKINTITHFFLKILQRNSKLVILGNLGMSGHTPKMIVSIWWLVVSI